MVPPGRERKGGKEVGRLAAGLAGLRGKWEWDRGKEKGPRKKGIRPEGKSEKENDFQI